MDDGFATLTSYCDVALLATKIDKLVQMWLIKNILTFYSRRKTRVFDIKKKSKTTFFLHCIWQIAERLTQGHRLRTWKTNLFISHCL